MSSMLRVSPLLLTISLACRGAPAWGQDGREWDIARARSLPSHDMAVHQSIDRWRQLVASAQMGFSAYASFLLTYPGYPQETKIRGFAEQALLAESPDPATVIAFFDR